MCQVQTVSFVVPPKLYGESKQGFILN